MKPFKFHNPGRLVFGQGAIKNIANELNTLSAKRPILVTDEGLAPTPIVASVKDALSKVLAAEFTGVVPDTGIEIIDQAVKVAREAGADSVVSVGGGSSMDTAKGIAAMLTSEADSIKDLVGFFKLKQLPAPHLAVPTTEGTGSECTSMAVVKDRAEGKKLLIIDPRLIPQVGILDPELTTSMPKEVTAGTGMDAMTHAAESVMSTSAMPPADALALHAISLIVEYLPRAIDKGDDIEARGMMLIASAEAGQAFQNAYVGIVHAMAHALGGIFGVPHGKGNGMLLWLGMEYNAATVPEKVAMIGKAMGKTMTGKGEEDAGSAIDAMREFAKTVGMPEKIADAGVDTSRLADAAALALADPALATNPRKPESAKELEEIYKRLV